MTRSRVPCASMPRAEIASALVRSMLVPLLAASEGQAEEAEIFGVEIRYQFLGRLGVGDLHQLVLDRHGIAVRRAFRRLLPSRLLQDAALRSRQVIGLRLYGGRGSR